MSGAAGTIINVSDLGPAGWDWLGGRFPEDRFDWITYSGRDSNWFERRVNRPQVGRYRACVQAALAAKRHDAKLLITHEPLVTAWTGALHQGLRLRMPQFAQAFTFSKLPTGARRAFITQAIRHIDRFVCFSNIERTRYAEYFDIPIEKIDAIRWSVSEPDFDASAPPLEKVPYLCAVGSEGRDYAVLAAAMRQLPELRLALVARPENLKGIDLPPNVVVRTNIPLSDVWNVVAHARLMVLPLRDTQVPCGHGTLIMAMQLRTPSIVTESEGMTDYIEHNKTGLICPPGDPDALAETIRRLWFDDSLSAQLADRGRTFAIEECSERSTAAYFVNYLRHRGIL